VFSVLQQATKQSTKEVRKKERKAWGFSSTQVQPFVCLFVCLLQQHGR
jgi:hypothetical protein